MLDQTYEERVLRFRIMRHEELPEAHKASYRADGIDPDTLWSLIWSFADRDSAERRLSELQARAKSWQTYKLVDAGSEVTITRPLY